MLTITASRLQVIRSSDRSQTWALSSSNVLRQDAQSQLALKPSPSAFAASLKHGSKCTVPSAGTSMERRYGSLRKRQLLCASAKALRSEQTQIQSYTRRSVFFADSLRERSRGIEINRRELTLRAWTIGRAVWFAVHDRQGLLNLPVNRSLQFGYSTSATETRGRKELGYRAMHRASTKHGRPCKWDTSIASECQAVV